MKRSIELAMAQWSYRYFKRTRKRRLPEISRALAPTIAPRWVTLSEWLQAAPERLDLIYLLGPRWNCSGLLAFGQRFDVQEQIAIDVSVIRDQAPYWTVVVYDQALRTIVSIGSNQNLDPTAPRVIHTVPPGNYFIVLRYYETPVRTPLPAVYADGVLVIPEGLMEQEQDQYDAVLRRVARRKRRVQDLLLQLHSYLYLKHRQTLDPDFVYRMYLPVGNPETHFQFDCIEKGQRLIFQQSPEVHSYISFYDRCSLPVHWQKLDRDQELIAPSTGSYLIRNISNATAPLLPTVEHRPS